MSNSGSLLSDREILGRVRVEWDANQRLAGSEDDVGDSQLAAGLEDVVGAKVGLESVV